MFVVEQPLANSMVPKRRWEPLQKNYDEKNIVDEEGFLL
jgi:hypothetical protein